MLAPVVSNVAPPAPSAIPRRALSVNDAVAWSVPPFRVRWPGVAAAGAVPRPASAATDTVPALIVVEPV